MNRKFELLAPGGDLESVKAAIAAGADAIYCGLNKFNARNRATNIELADLNEILNLAHRNDCQVFLTINIIILENEIRALIKLLNTLVNMKIDGVIVQDLGLLYLLSSHFKSLKVHASTQLTTHNEGQLKFLRKLGVTRVNLSRELNIGEITELARFGHKNNLLSEVFVHGSNCISFSGLCYISSVLQGKSGNRGRCSQPCREQYLTTPAGHDFPLNLKDNSAFNDLRSLAEAGVDSLKIEGRMKNFHYVYTVVEAWRKLLDNFYQHDQTSGDATDLYRVFNRDFSNGFLQGEISADMFIDNPRDNSARHFAALNGRCDAGGIDTAKRELHEARTAIINRVKRHIAALDTSKFPITISITGTAGGPLIATVTRAGTSFVLQSETKLVPVTAEPGHRDAKNSFCGLDYARVFERLQPINETEYWIEELEVENLTKGLFLPLKELTEIGQKILFILNGSSAKIAPLAAPRLAPANPVAVAPSLAVLISDRAQLALCRGTSAEIFFQLPNCFGADTTAFVDLFLEHPELTPWFPAVLIGKEYAAAVALLARVKPRRIVTNNTGIATAANELGIAWLAGPYLNTVNSFCLLGLKEQFNCSGAFISNEISLKQMRNIVAPPDFKLYYSIYHPIVLMTSRQCLLHPVEGCAKSVLDKDCTLDCTKSSAITNLKNVPLFIDKSRGCYHRLYNNHNFLNTDIVADLPGRFAGFLIDLSEIATATKVAGDTGNIIRLFERLLQGDPEAKTEIEQAIQPATNAQYLRGI